MEANWLEPDIEDLLEKVIREERTAYGDKSTRGFRGLRVWQVSLDLVVEVYRLTESFPKTEQFGLTSQLRRAATSANLNIAEGWGRDTPKELARFCEIARGSVHEVHSAIPVAERLGFITAKEQSVALDLVESLSPMLKAFIQRIRD